MVHGDRLAGRVLFAGGLGFVVILAVWPWLQLQNGMNPANVQSGVFRIDSIGIAVSQAARLPTILREIGRYYVERPWITLPFLAAVGVSLHRQEILDRQRRFLLAFVALHLLFVVTVFWLTQLPFEWHLATALHRLLMQGRLVMLLFICETAMLRWAPLAQARFVRGPATERAELVHAGSAQRQRTF